MKEIKSKVGYVGTEHFVVIADDELTKIDFGQQVDDILIVSPDGDVLVSWDDDEWSDDECLLIQSKDNLKEINNVRCTHFYVKSKDGKQIKVYVTGQRN